MRGFRWRARVQREERVDEEEEEERVGEEGDGGVILSHEEAQGVCDRRGVEAVAKVGSRATTHPIEGDGNGIEVRDLRGSMGVVIEGVFFMTHPVLMMTSSSANSEVKESSSKDESPSVSNPSKEFSLERSVELTMLSGKEGDGEEGRSARMKELPKKEVVVFLFVMMVEMISEDEAVGVAS